MGRGSGAGWTRLRYFMAFLHAYAGSAERRIKDRRGAGETGRGRLWRGEIVCIMTGRLRDGENGRGRDYSLIKIIF